MIPTMIKIPPAIHMPELTNLIKYSPDSCKFIDNSKDGANVMNANGSSNDTPKANLIAIPIMINTIPIVNNEACIFCTMMIHLNKFMFVH